MPGRSLTIAFVALACLMAPLGCAQEGPSGTASTSHRPVFRSAVELVALNVTVLDEHKRFIAGLGPEDFLVYENGVRSARQCIGSYFRMVNVRVASQALQVRTRRGYYSAQ
jgi:hypothetical protein